MSEASSKCAVWKRIGLRLVDIAAGGSVIATVLAFGGRLHWTLDLATHMRAQCAAALVVAAICYAVRRRWKLLALVVAAAMPNLWAVSPAYLPAPVSPSEIGPSFKLAAVNLFAWSDSYDRVADYVRSANPDVVVFVEYTHAWFDGLKPLAAEFPHVRHFPRKDPFGVAVYSRLPLDDVRPEDSPHGHLFLRAKATIGDRHVTIFGVHPPPPISRAGWQARNDDLRFVAELAKQETGPTVIIGDLNVTSWSPFFHDLLQTSGLRDSRLGRGLQPTWPTHFPPPLRIPIDHCLVSPNIRVLDRQTGPDVGSDHLPIDVRLAIGQ